MKKKRFVVVGAGNMARIRTRAFLNTEKAILCGVASKHLQKASAFAKEFDCPVFYDNYSKLSKCKPDAVLVEVPHEIQDQVVNWAIDSGFHVLIGGCLSCSIDDAKKIIKTARKKNLIIEAGYEARYKPVWKEAKQQLENGTLGSLIAFQSIALWPADPKSWYYNQKQSGGMPLTHMTYTFINPIRWLLGNPLYVSAFSNRKKYTQPGFVDEETCIANMLFPNGVLGSMAAGYVKIGEIPGWMVKFLGTDAAMEIFPSDMGSGSLKIYKKEQILTHEFEDAPNAFGVQAKVFLQSLDGENRCQNDPETTFGDLLVAQAIVSSTRKKETVTIPVNTRQY